MRQVTFPETSPTNYQSTPHTTPEERRTLSFYYYLPTYLLLITYSLLTYYLLFTYLLLNYFRTYLLITYLFTYLLTYLLTYRTFPNLIRNSFCRFLKQKKKFSSRFQSAPFLQPPPEVARWLSAARKAIPDSIIVRSFKKCRISNALDGSEDGILWEDDGEDKDDSDWLTDSDSVMSDDGESGE